MLSLPFFHGSCVLYMSKEAMTTDTKTFQLTIFYSGWVLVFDDYPSNKVKELVACAKKGSSQMSYGISSNTLGEKPNPSVAAAATSVPKEGLPPRPQACGSHKAVSISSNTCKDITNTDVGGTLVTNSTSEKQDPPESEAGGSDMPIARRSSLHQFLAKRKDSFISRMEVRRSQNQRLDWLCPTAHVLE